jgi:hypothetical protein
MSLVPTGFLLRCRDCRGSHTSPAIVEVSARVNFPTSYVSDSLEGEARCICGVAVRNARSRIYTCLQYRPNGFTVLHCQWQTTAYDMLPYVPDILDRNGDVRASSRIVSPRS